MEQKGWMPMRYPHLPSTVSAIEGLEGNKWLKGEYFNSIDLTNPAFTRIDSNVSFSEWASGVHYKITSNKYSVRWTGQIEPQFSEKYIFYIGSGGGHRLWIDNKLIVEGWMENYPDTFASMPIYLIAGQKYDIRLEYFNDNTNSVIGLFWSCPSLPLEYVPQSQLYPSTISNPQLPNSNPIANAGADVIISLPENSVKLNGVASFDPDGTLVSYKWSKVQGPKEYSLATPDSVSTLVTNLVEGIYIFQLSVTDNSGTTGQDEVMVSVIPAPSTNTELIANAGSDIMITLPRNFTTLNGSASLISDPNRSRCNWQKLSGPSQFTIGNPTALSTSLNNLVEGVYVFKLTLTNDDGRTSEDEIKITVNPVEILPSVLTITAFPNPTTSYFQIKVTSNSDLRIRVRIINRWGFVVATYYNLQNNSIITTSSNIRSGIYYAIAEQGDQKKIITLMKL